MRNRSSYIANDNILHSLKREVAEYFISADGEDYSHGISHAERVVGLAHILQCKEGGNTFVISAAALLHDIARSQEERGECENHAAKGAVLARDILVKYGLSTGTIEEIAYCIENHSANGEGKTLESKIIRDADKLDSLGAIAISRVIASTLQSRRYRRPIFDPSNCAGGGEMSSAIGYLELLVERSEGKEYFFTRSARHMAGKRVRLMREYIGNFKQEWFLSEIDQGEGNKAGGSPG